MGSYVFDTSPHLNREESALDLVQSKQQRVSLLRAGSDWSENEGCPTCLQPNVSESFEHLSVAVLVSDMSGFTRLTREHGILHVASIIVRARQLCYPILHRFSAMHISTEGDNFLVVFPSAAKAVAAAREMFRVVRASNAQLQPGREHFASTLNTIGIDYGKGPILDATGKLLGQTFTNAYALGEEMCNPGSIAISGRLKAELDKCSESVVGELRRRDFTEDVEAATAAQRMGGVWEIVEEDPTSCVIELPSVDDASYITPALLPLAQRQRLSLSDAEMKVLDQEIVAKHMMKKAVLMFEFEYFGIEEPFLQLIFKFDVLSKIRPILKKHSGTEVEDILHVFDSPVNAILMAVAMQRAVPRPGPGQTGVAIRGLGLHVGELLYLPSTDVHWGDPVNTASKLGQDVAREGMLYVTMEVFAAAQLDPRTAKLPFDKAAVVKSGVALECRILQSPVDEDILKLNVVHTLGIAGMLGTGNTIDRHRLRRLLVQLDPGLSSPALDRLLEASTVQGGAIDLPWLLDLRITQSLA